MTTYDEALGFVVYGLGGFGLFLAFVIAAFLLLLVGMRGSLRRILSGDDRIIPFGAAVVTFLALVSTGAQFYYSYVFGPRYHLVDLVGVWNCGKDDKGKEQKCQILHAPSWLIPSATVVNSSPCAAPATFDGYKFLVGKIECWEIGDIGRLESKGDAIRWGTDAKTADSYWRQEITK
jgi:hypothetical protein